MNDNERCELIAEWADADCQRCGISRSNHNEHSCLAYWAPDFVSDLTATMRAARKLPLGERLIVTSEGRAYIFIGRERTTKPVEIDAGPARAAFLALSDYLSK